MTQDQIIRLAALRQKQLAGTISREELKEAITIMREDRVLAQVKPKAAGKPKAAPVDVDKLLEGW